MRSIARREKLRIAFSGVRISWLMFARNWRRTRAARALAANARLFDCSAAMPSLASWMLSSTSLEGEVGVGAAAGRRVDDEQHVGDRVDDAAQPRLGRHRVARIALRIG